MERLTSVKGWVFDLDGTLVDSRLDFDELRTLMNIPRGEPILEYLATIKDPQQYARLMQIVDDYEWQGHERATLIEGCAQFLGLLKKAQLPLALLTRNSERVARAGIEKFGLDHFDLVISRDHDLKPKPAPDGLLHICQQWSLGAHEIVYVGDFDFDMEAAHNAGALGLYFNPQGQAVPLKASLSFSHYQELISLFAPTTA